MTQYAEEPVAGEVHTLVVVAPPHAPPPGHGAPTLRFAGTIEEARRILADGLPRLVVLDPHHADGRALVEEFDLARRTVVIFGSRVHTDAPRVVRREGGGPAGAEAPGPCGVCPWTVQGFPGNVPVDSQGIRVLGPFRARRGDAIGDVPGLGRTGLRLLAALVALGPSGGARHRLIEMVWGGPVDRAALDRFRATLFRLRAALGRSFDRPAADVIPATPRGKVWLNPLLVHVDAWELRAAALWSPTDPERLDAVLAHYRGPFMEELDGGEWLHAYRADCARAFREASARLVRARLAAGDPAAAEHAAGRLAHLDPEAGAADRLRAEIAAARGRRATAG